MSARLRKGLQETHVLKFLASAFLLPRVLTDVLFLLFVPSALRGVQHVTICTFQFCKKAGTCPLVWGSKNWNGLGSAGVAFPVTAACSRLKKSLNFRSKAERKNSSCSGVKIAEFRRLRSETNSCMFEAENSLNIALKQPLRSIEITAACSRLKSDQLRSKTTSLRSREITASCSRLKNFAQLRSETTSSIQRGITAACSRLKIAQFRSKAASFAQKTIQCC